MAVDNENDQEPQGQPNIRSLREAAENGKAAQEELARTKRELMFVKAGIDVESKLGRLLYQTWEGDDVTALKAEATELGIIGGTTTPPAADPNADVREQQQFRQGLSSGAPSGAFEPETKDPRISAMENFHLARSRGVPREQAALAAFDEIFTSAAAGDTRVIFDPDAWRSEMGAR